MTFGRGSRNEDRASTSRRRSRARVDPPSAILTPHSSLLRTVASAVLLTLIAGVARAEQLDEFSLEGWKKLRETERYQLKIAEKYYAEKKWKVAAAEYEKFLVLYERSEGAAFSQLKWSLCQRNLEQLNTAIKEGFQSVVDYWPESPEAVAAGYYIGRTYKELGEVRRAKTALKKVVTDHPKHLAAVHAAVDLIDIATIEKDTQAKVDLWRRLTFDVARTRDSLRICQDASRSLASEVFKEANFDEGVKALATTYDEAALPAQVVNHVRPPIQTLVADSANRAKGEKLADLAIAWVRRQMPATAVEEAEKQRSLQLWYAVADLQSSAARDDDVIAAYAEMEQRLGADDATLVRLGAWFKSRKRFDEARQTFARISDKLEANNQIAISHRDQGNFDLCVAAFDRNVGLDAEKPLRWREAVASTWHHHAKQYDRAIAVYEELLKADVERTPHWLWQLAQAHHQWGKHEQAIGYYRQCDNFPSNYWEMASCNRAMKKYDEAVILYNQIVGGSESLAPRALLQIGYTFEQAGKQDRAISSFQQVCKRFPKDSHASTAHAHLQTKYKINVTLGGATDEK